MVTLSIDTAANLCAVALTDTSTGNPLSAISRDIGRGHAEILMNVIDDVMKLADIHFGDIDKIVTTLGPGSFTGVRVGIATARAIGLGLTIPVVGVSVLQACAHHAGQIDKTGYEERIISVILDARRGEFYFQPFKQGKELQRGQLSNIEQLMEFHKDIDSGDVVFCGSGAPEFLSVLAEKRPGIEFSVAHQMATAPIESVAELGVTMQAGETRPEPLYMRGPDAKQQSGFAIERSHHGINEAS